MDAGPQRRIILDNADHPRINTLRTGIDDHRDERDDDDGYTRGNRVAEIFDTRNN